MPKKKDIFSLVSELDSNIKERYSRWLLLYADGCNDPYWSDGTNINLVRNHIHFYKKSCEIELGDKYYLYPDSYFFPDPKEVPDDFMANTREIRIKGITLPATLNKEPVSSMIQFDWSEVL